MYETCFTNSRGDSQSYENKVHYPHQLIFQALKDYAADGRK